MKTIKKVLLILAAITLLSAVGCWLFVHISGNSTATSTLSQEDMSEENENSLGEQEAEVSLSAPTAEPVPTPTPKPTPTPFPEYDITLMAVGDNLMHMGVVYTGRQEDGSWNYDFLFEGISDFLDIADIKVVNQETILGGNERGFSGYPYFNSPTEVGDAIVAAGFNVVLQASNHSADQDVDGLIYCAEFWDKHPEVIMTGIHADTSKAGDIPLLTIDDITFAILNYTYGPNMEILPEALEGHLELLCNYNPDTNHMDFTTLNPQVLTDIERAGELADIVIVFPHWGTEYVTEPSGYQETFALQMTEAGADLIIGTHPHVVQPVEWITAENGNRALCYYSLGNYVSTQKDGISMLEAMAWVTFHVDENGVSITETNTGVLPLVCHYTSGPVRIENIYLLENYTESQAASHGIRSYGGVNLTLEDLNTWSRDILGDRILTCKEVLTPAP
ncbi:MAG: CapA family protein [Lachnospiraceae bacterium]|nr:CapA family protein [Lachnospiraceae bacterium]